jgi:hypothetical protein
VSEEPISPYFDADIEYEEDHSCLIELRHNFLEFLMPEDPEHPTREIPYSRTKYRPQDQMRNSDISEIEPISSYTEYDENDKDKYLKSPEKLGINMFFGNVSFFREISGKCAHSI